MITQSFKLLITGVFLAGWAASSNGWAGEIYKCPQSNGRWTFSDKPCPDGSYQQGNGWVRVKESQSTSLAPVNPSLQSNKVSVSAIEPRLKRVELSGTELELEARLKQAVVDAENPGDKRLLILATKPLARFYELRGHREESLAVYDQYINVVAESNSTLLPKLRPSNTTLEEGYLLIRGLGPYFTEAYLKYLLEHTTVEKDPQNIAQITVQGYLSLLYSEFDRQDDTVSYLNRAIELSEETLSRLKVNPPEDLVEINQAVWNWKAEYYQKIGEYEEAEQAYNNLVKKLELAYDSTVKRNLYQKPLIQQYDKLAAFYLSQKRYQKAGIWYEKAFELREKVLGADHPELAKMLHLMGLNHLTQNRFKEAEEAFKRGLSIAQNSEQEGFIYVKDLSEDLQKLQLARTH